MIDDTRNVMDEFKGLPHEEIVAQLDERGICLEIAIENLTRDYNMGTIVRSANAFGVRTVHIIGRKQWNKRGAMKTDAYLTVVYHDSVKEFVSSVQGKEIVAVDNVSGARDCSEVEFSDNTILVFGAEGPGLSDTLLAVAHRVVMITQKGSTRSINVGVAAGILMYEWVRQRKT